MEERIFTFENDSIKITYDAKRCIHAAECVKGLKKVFDPDKRPWIQPEPEEAENIAEVVQHCPPGLFTTSPKTKTWRPSELRQ